MRISRTFALVAALAAAGTGTAFAGASSQTIKNMSQSTAYQQETIGQKLENGSLSLAQVRQLIQFTGLTLEDAKTYTVPQITALRWENS
jgi:hypothetical protein